MKRKNGFTAMPMPKNWVRALYIIWNRKLRKIDNDLLIGIVAGLILILQMFIIVQAVGAQDRSIYRAYGSVLDEKGAPLPGASVKVKSTGKSTTTGKDGEFELANLSVNDILVISFLGYQTEQINVAERLMPLEIVMVPDAVQMQEVVVSTGYQDLPLERATGSFATVSKELFNRQVSTDVISRLKAVAPSLLFDERSGTTKLGIRGRSTIFANDQPLIVVDNFPYDGDVRNLNPNDVETITILKDAAAASIWGAKAGNGVIVITTKPGHLNQPLTIDANSSVTVTDRPDLFYTPAMSSSDFIDVEQRLFSSGYYNADLNNTLSRPPISPVIELLARQKDGELTAAEAESLINAMRRNDLRQDLHKHFYQRGINQQYAVSLKGGSDQHSYYVSAGFDDNLSTMVGNRTNRLTLNARQNYKFGKLDLQTGIGYVQSLARTNNVISEIYTGGPSGKVMYPYTRLIDDQGNHLPVVKDYAGSFKSGALGLGLLDWNFVPLNELNLVDDATRLNEARLQAGVKYQLLNSLSAEVKYQYERQGTDGRDLRSAESYFVRNIINRYSIVNGNGIFRNIPVGSFLNRSNSLLNAHNGRAQLNYNHQWSRHQLAGMAGVEVREVITSANRNRYYGYNADLGSSLPVSHTTRFPLYPSGTGLIPTEQGVSGTTDRFRSWFGNAAYTYGDRYTVSASGRIDQSNFFGLKRNQRAVPLWSAGVKWDAAREDFYRIAWLPELSVRATYGFNGNIDKSVTAFTTANFSSNTFTGTPALNINNPANPHLRWEKTGILNVGVSFAAVGNIVKGNVEFYQKRGLDLIGDSPLDPTTGLNNYRGNVAGMKGHGFDVELNSINLDRKLKWESSFLFSYATDEVTSYNETPAFAAYMADASLTGSTSSFTPTPGRPLFGIYSRRWAGLDASGNPMGYVNGQPSINYSALNSSVGQTVDSLVFHGRALPPVFGAIRNDLSYKNWSLSVNVSYRFGYYFKRSSIDYSALFTRGQGHSDYALRWQKPGDEQHTHVPSMPAVANSARDNFYRNAEILVEQGDNIRLQDIALSYALSKDRLRRLPFKNLRLHAYVSNPGIIWKANDAGIDPDFPSSKPPISVAFGIRTSL